MAEQDSDPFAEFGGKATPPPKTNSDPFAEFGGKATPQKKSPVGNASQFGSQQSNNGGLNLLNTANYSRDSHQTAPIKPIQPNQRPIDPNKQLQINRLNEAINSQKAVQKIKEQAYPNAMQADTRKAYEKMPKNQQQDFINSAQFGLADLSNLRNFTPKDLEHWQYLNETTGGQVQRGLQYTGSKLSKGAIQIGEGIAHIATLPTVPFTDKASKAVTQAADWAQEHTNFGLTKGDVMDIEKNPINKALGDFTEMIPSIWGGEATGANKVVFGLQGVGMGRQEIEHTDASPMAKAVYPMLTGTVNALLMGDASSNIFGKLSTPLKTDIVNDVSANIIKDAAGKPITDEMVQEASKSALQKLKQGGINYLKSSGRASLDISALNSVNLALKKGTNAVEGKQVFDTSNQDFIGAIGEGVKQGLEFGIPGILHGESDVHDQISNALINDPNQVEKIKQDLVNHAQQSGWTPEETKAASDHIDRIAEAAKTLPNTIPENKRAKAVSLLLGRQDLENQLQEEQIKRNQLDPAIKDVVSPNEQLVSDKIEQANDKLRDIVTGTKTTYSKGTGDEEGKFFKTINGQKEEISQSRYELENLERSAKANTPTENVGKETPQQATPEKTDEEIINNSLNTPKNENDGKTTERTSQEEKESTGGQMAEQPLETNQRPQGDKEGKEKNDQGGSVSKGGEEPPLKKPRYSIRGEEVTLKQEENAIQKQSTGEMGIRQQEAVGEGVGRQNQSKEPTEKSEKEISEKNTGIKKAISDATRINRNLPEVKLTKFAGNDETLIKGKENVDSGKINPKAIAQSIIESPRTYTPDEASAMQYYGYQLAQQEKTLQEAYNEASDDDKIAIHSNMQQLSDAIDQKTQSDRINSREWSNLGRTMQIEADQSFSPAQVRSVIRHNYGGVIPKEVEERLSKAEAERDKAIAALKKAESELTNKNGEVLIDKLKKSVIKKSKEQLQTEAEQLRKDLKAALKKDFGRLNSGIPIPIETLETLGKLAVNYFQQGVKDFEGLVNRIHQDIPEADKKQLREYLSNYDPLREESKSRRLGLLGKKERSLTKQLETGELRDYSRKPEILFKKDNNVIRAEQRVSDAEYKIKQEKIKSYRANESKVQRGANWFLRWQRRAILSNPLTSLKLLSASLSSPVLRAPKEPIGAMYSALFKQLGEKAMIEGGMNMQAEAKYWKEYFNPKKFLTDAAQIFKTGASPLKKQFSEKDIEHHPGWDALQDIHAVLKAPAQRAVHEASTIKAYNWAAKQGLDYTDPLVQRYLDHAAFGRANYEIFQEDNTLGKKISRLIDDETSTNSVKRFIYKFMFPINLVPTNITSRVASHIFGLPRGLVLTAQAYRKGIENLTPQEADFIMRQLKNGSVGMAYFSTGMFLAGKNLTGLYQKDDKPKPIGEAPNFMNLKYGEKPLNTMSVNGANIDKRLQHGMPLHLLQSGATYMRVYDHYYNNDSGTKGIIKFLNANANAAMSVSGSEAEESPFLNTPYHALGALFEPYMRKQFLKDLVPYPVQEITGMDKKPRKTHFSLKN